MDYHQVDVVSLAVLADTNENYRPTTFKFSRSGTENTFTYPIAKQTLLIACKPEQTSHKVP